MPVDGYPVIGVRKIRGRILVLWQGFVGVGHFHATHPAAFMTMAIAMCKGDWD
jgi:hypothetical protein